MTENKIQTAGENLLLCLRQEARQEKIERAARFSRQEWAAILEQAQRHNLMAVLFWELNALAPEFEIPEDVRERLRQASLLNAQKNMKLYLELRPVLQALHERGIPNIVLKGAHLAALVYPDLSLRTMGDIDIMVPKERLGEAAEALEGIGYRATKPYDIESTLALRHHLPPLGKPNCHLIEVHWRIFPPTYPFTLDLDGLWQRAQPTTIANSETLVLSAEDLILHLCIHATYQHQFSFGLRSLYDITLSLSQLKNAIDWEKVQTLADLWGGQKAVFLTLETCQTLLGAPIPGDVIEALRPTDYKDEISEQIRAYSLNAPQDYSHNFIALFDEESTMQKASHILRRIFPTRDTLSVYYGISPRSPKILLYYPYRLVIVLRDNLQRLWLFIRRDPEFISLVRERKALLELKHWLESR